MVDSPQSLAFGVVILSIAVWAATRGKKKKRVPVDKPPLLPQWLQWLQTDPSHYRVFMREWEDATWRKTHGWRGSDLIHGAGSAIHIPCYFYNPEEKTLRGPVTFNPGSESHRGLCHGGAMTSALDDVLGHVCFLGVGGGPWSGATVQVNCKLMRPVTVGQTLLLEGKVERQEKQKVFISGILKGEGDVIYAQMDGLSISAVKMQKEESSLDKRTWHYDEARRAVYDSAWDMEPVEPVKGG